MQVPSYGTLGTTTVRQTATHMATLRVTSLHNSAITCTLPWCQRSDSNTFASLSCPNQQVVLPYAKDMKSQHECPCTCLCNVHLDRQEDSKWPETQGPQQAHNIIEKRHQHGNDCSSKQALRYNWNVQCSCVEQCAAVAPAAASSNDPIRHCPPGGSRATPLH